MWWSEIDKGIMAMIAGDHVYDVVIVGAGIAGLATAVGLYGRGITNILVLEKATSFQKVGASIAIFQNGLNALEYILKFHRQAYQKIRDSLIPIEKIIIKDGITGQILKEKSLLALNTTTNKDNRYEDEDENDSLNTNTSANDGNDNGNNENSNTNTNSSAKTNVNYMVWYLLQQYLREGLPSHIVKLNHKVHSFEINTTPSNNNNNNHNVTIHIQQQQKQQQQSQSNNDYDNNNDKDINSTTVTTMLPIRSKVLIGCDGINSMIRNHLFFNSNNNAHTHTDIDNVVPPVRKIYHGKVSYRCVFSVESLLLRKEENCNYIDDDDKIKTTTSNKSNNESNNEYCIKIPPEGTNTSYQNNEKGKLFSFRRTAPGIITVTSMAPIKDPTIDYSVSNSSSSSSSSSSSMGTTASSSSSSKKQLRQQRFKEVFNNFTAPEIQTILNLNNNNNDKDGGSTTDNYNYDVHIDPIHDIDVLNCWSKGPVICIGDSVHAMSPSLGQGANQSLEDVCVLISNLAPVLILLSKSKSKSKHQRQHQRDDDDDDLLLIQNTLTKVWKSRIDRVKRIHSASRRRSFVNNHTSSNSTTSTKTATETSMSASTSKNCNENHCNNKHNKLIDISSNELDDLLLEINNWYPPTVDIDADADADEYVDVVE
ncbi:FAD/NAD(P)-binding domain-containing protein [Fragilariopsis cylindrus CCMP1102]|uniref:FAD/NAD(P)-binding domain-containing protein n=1 Tax=Fragilariopsis cylindrus CCMP1102 TaxID=635003 RepID=A0A1E7F610_9STRA|nr:FAD/NAD(P)-binding domain-containing protein [Fragilariopsis cylindrus CCMP1102]|eukprot:OEU13631.1 FAD/NAD(P)-binding domain-containing protein [Fragilariopsis cylindrus CCMP1102]